MDPATPPPEATLPATSDLERGRARDELILQHLVLYRLTLRAVLDELFFEGRSSDNVVERLKKQGHIQVQRGLPGRLSYYQLTEAEARRRALPEERAQAPGPRALAEHLSVLWFCTLGARPRRRLEADELQRLLPELPSARPHAIEDGTPRRVLRLFIPGPTSPVESTIRAVSDETRELAANPVHAPWLKTRRFAVAILAQNQARAKTFREEIELAEAQAFTDVSIEVVPGLDELSEALRERAKQTSLGAPAGDVPSGV